MTDQALPIVLVPGLRCSARLYAPQIPALWQRGPVMIADHTKGDTIAEIARRRPAQGIAFACFGNAANTASGTRKLVASNSGELPAIQAVKEIDS
jgi:hypothetical protein